MKREEARKLTYLRILEQQKWWRSRSEGLIKVKSMERGHLLNTLAWLERNADMFAAQLSADALSASLMAGDDPSDGVYFAMLGWEGEAEEAVADPVAWMRSRPLYRRMAEIAAIELQS